MNNDQAQAFAESTVRLVTESNKLARCVDGRYEDLPDEPMVAKPGGDAGDIMAVMSALNFLQLNLPAEKVLDIVADNIGGVANFRFHSDEHADPAILGIGCGHIKQAKLDPAAYGLTEEQIDFLLEQLPALVEQGAQQEVLRGDHAEQAVIVVDSAAYGLVPLLRNESEVQQAFIYHKTLHTAQLDNLANLMQEALAEQGQAIEQQQIRAALNDAFGQQLTETLKRLASGLPIYTAAISDDGEIEIRE